jgi:hypothetical protein
LIIFVFSDYYLNKNLVGLILPDHDPKNGGFPVRLVKND